MAIAGGRKTIGVIGAGMIGVTTASFLLRRGHDIVLLDPGNPGEGTSFGNAGCFNGSSVVPMSMPGIIRSVPKWLADPLGPLVLRLGYLPSLAPWLIRFIRAGTPDEVRHQARALRTLLDQGIETLAPLVQNAGAQDLVQRMGHLFVYRSLTSWQKERAAWNLRADNGITWHEFDVDELRQLDPNLSREYVKGILVRENGHTTNPHRLVNSLASAFQRDGGRIERRRAVGFDVVDGRLKAIRCGDGALAVDAAVLAAGIWSKPLGRRSWDDCVPLETERGYHLMIRDSGSDVPHSRRRRGRQVRRDADGAGLATRRHGRACGARRATQLGARSILLRHAKRMFPALRSDYPEGRLSMWMGHRPSLPDSLPVIGGRIGHPMSSMPLVMATSAWPARPRPARPLPRYSPASHPKLTLNPSVHGGSMRCLLGDGPADLAGGRGVILVPTGTVS